jgi:hypothetical protein
VERINPVSFGAPFGGSLGNGESSFGAEAVKSRRKYVFHHLTNVLDVLSKPSASLGHKRKTHDASTQIGLFDDVQ